MRPGPTQAIKERARRQHGVIRWCEARDEYVASSPNAEREERRARRYHEHNGRAYHMSLGRTLERNFVRVEGVEGLYVLRDYAPDVAAARLNAEAS